MVVSSLAAREVCGGAGRASSFLKCGCHDHSAQSGLHEDACAKGPSPTPSLLRVVCARSPWIGKERLRVAMGRLQRAYLHSSCFCFPVGTGK